MDSLEVVRIAASGMEAQREALDVFARNVAASQAAGPKGSYESGFDPNATSPAGAQGLMQLEPATAAGLGVTDPYDPVQNLNGGSRYIRGLLDRFHGDVRRAVAAYNAVPHAVEKYGGVPPYAETRAYVDHVLENYRRYKKQP